MRPQGREYMSIPTSVIDVFCRMTPAGRACAFGLASIIFTLVWSVLLLFFIDRGKVISTPHYSAIGVIQARCERFSGGGSILFCAIQLLESEQVRRASARLYVDSARCNEAVLAVGSEVKLLVGKVGSGDRYKVWRAEDASGCVLYDEGVSNYVARVTNRAVFGYALFFLVLSLVCFGLSAFFWFTVRPKT